MELVLKSVILGVSATLAIDIWATITNKLFKLPTTNWGMVGRWLGHIPGGVFFHDQIGLSAPVRNELAIGWLFHYLIGLLYAVMYVSLVSLFMDKIPTLLTAWVFGLITIISPWLIMQPGLGLGICANKSNRPNVVRLQNLAIHSIYGVMLYFSWVASNVLLLPSNA